MHLTFTSDLECSISERTISGKIVPFDGEIGQTSAGKVVFEKGSIEIPDSPKPKLLLEHDAKIADHCHISTGAILNGNTTIGSGSFVGSGSIIKEGASIGQGCLVGMGLAVRHNLIDNVRFTGRTIL